MKHFGIKLITLGFFIASLLGGATPAAAATNSLKQLAGHVPAATIGLVPQQSLPTADLLPLAIGLNPHHSAELDQLLVQLYDPASTNYHCYLTPEQFGDRFGATPAEYQAVLDFARKNGLTIIRTHPHRMVVEVSGSVAAIEQAFHVTLNVYQHPTENRRFFAPDQEPTVAADLNIADVSGLDDYVIPKPMSLHAAPAGISPQSGSGSYGYYQGYDFRNAYLPKVALNGAGQSVALLEFDGYAASDITAYENLTGLPGVTLTNILLNNYNGGAGTNETEVCLDIEMAIAMAPGLDRVMVYEGTSASSILSRMLSDNVAKQISASWTFSLSTMTTNLFRELAAQGISYFNASGDSGAYSGAPASPSDAVNVISVGGTELYTTGPLGGYTSETTWSWFPGTTAATSGGISTRYPIPTWQTGLPASTNQASTSSRNLPDVAFTAANIWVTHGSGKAGGVGGTSCAAPLWAGFTALINQQARANGQTNVGFLNPALYALAKGTNYGNVFHDITTGNNTNASSPNNFYATPGYDLCTGLGSPQGPQLMAAMVNPAPFFTNQPVSQQAISGNNVTFTSGLSGIGPFFYNWSFNGTLIPGATNATYSVTNAQSVNSGTYSVVASNAYAAVTSSNAVLNVITAFTITAQPTNQSVALNGSVEFDIGVSNSVPVTYQWYFNMTNLLDSTSNSLVLTNVQTNQAGNYDAVVSSSYGAVTSSVATLTVDSPPTITTAPGSRTNLIGTTASFIVHASGTAPLLYQWQFFGTNILSATNLILVLNNVQAGNAGYYDVVVSNAYGSVTSGPVSLSISGVPVILATNQNALQFSNGIFGLQLQQLTGQGTLIIQSSTNLYDWTSLYTNPPAFGALQFYDADAANHGQNFYRVIVMP